MKYSTGLSPPKRSGKVKRTWINLTDFELWYSQYRSDFRRTFSCFESKLSTLINFEKKWNRFQPFHLWKHLAKSTGGSRIRYSGMVYFWSWTVTWGRTQENISNPLRTEQIWRFDLLKILIVLHEFWRIMISNRECFSKPEVTFLNRKFKIF